MGDMQSLISTLGPLILIIPVFYFLVIRPQQQKQKEHKALLDNLKKGDTVITQGGLYGKVAAVSDHVLTLEIADKVRVRVSRAHIAGLAPSGSEPTS
jgi:preprotein translocase subunit YajC